MQCQALTADKAQVKTQGGSISLGRLVGQHCVLDASDTPLDSSMSAAAEPSTSGRYWSKSEACCTLSLNKWYQHYSSQTSYVSQ